MMRELTYYYYIVHETKLRSDYTQSCIGVIDILVCPCQVKQVRIG